MKKVGNYIVGASVAVALAGNPTSASAQEIVANTSQDGHKIEYIQDNLRDTLKSDSIIAWETLANNEQQLNTPPKDSSREDTTQELLKDSINFNNTSSIINKIKETKINNVPQKTSDSNNLSIEECASNAILACMSQQTTHKRRIAQRYGTDDIAQQEGNNNVYGDFLEYLATSGDKKLGKALGIPDEEMTPENITMALAYAPKIPYEIQETLYKEALDDGRVDKYDENSRYIAVNNERYSELSITDEMPKDAARLSIGIEKSNEFADRIRDRYGENANALLIKAFTGDKELAEKLGFKDEKPDAQQLVYMLACAEPISKEDQNKMITEQDRIAADNILDYISNKNHKTDYFTLNTKEQKAENSVQSVVDMFNNKQTADTAHDLASKLRDDLAKINPKTELANNTMAINMARILQHNEH